MYLYSMRISYVLGVYIVYIVFFICLVHLYMFVLLYVWKVYSYENIVYIMIAYMCVSHRYYIANNNNNNDNSNNDNSNNNNNSFRLRVPIPVYISRI